MAQDNASSSWTYPYVAEGKDQHRNSLSAQRCLTGKPMLLSAVWLYLILNKMPVACNWDVWLHMKILQNSQSSQITKVLRRTIFVSQICLIWVPKQAPLETLGSRKSKERSVILASMEEYPGSFEIKCEAHSDCLMCPRITSVAVRALQRCYRSSGKNFFLSGTLHFRPIFAPESSTDRRGGQATTFLLLIALKDLKSDNSHGQVTRSHRLLKPSLYRQNTNRSFDVAVSSQRVTVRASKLVLNPYMLIDSSSVLLGEMSTARKG